MYHVISNKTRAYELSVCLKGLHDTVDVAREIRHDARSIFPRVSTVRVIFDKGLSNLLPPDTVDWIFILTSFPIWNLNQPGPRILRTFSWTRKAGHVTQMEAGLSAVDVFFNISILIQSFRLFLGNYSTKINETRTVRKFRQFYSCCEWKIVEIAPKFSVILQISVFFLNSALSRQIIVYCSIVWLV